MDYLNKIQNYGSRPKSSILKMSKKKTLENKSEKFTPRPVSVNLKNDRGTFKTLTK